MVRRKVKQNVHVSTSIILLTTAIIKKTNKSTARKGQRNLIHTLNAFVGPN